MGFWVAMTKKGSGSGRVLPSTVTLRSCMASSSADWVLAGARLISSASKSWVNTGPRRNSKAPRCWLNTLPPVTSEGMGSGVNWMRLCSHPSTSPSVRTSRVLPRPGAPASSTCPRDSTAIRVWSTVSSWPITARATSARTRSTCSLNSAAFTGSSCLFEQRRQLGQHGQVLGVAGGGGDLSGLGVGGLRGGALGLDQHAHHRAQGAAGAGGHRLGHRREVARRAQVQALAQPLEGVGPVELEAQSAGAGAGVLQPHRARVLDEGAAAIAGGAVLPLQGGALRAAHGPRARTQPRLRRAPAARAPGAVAGPRGARG